MCAVGWKRCCCRGMVVLRHPQNEQVVATACSAHCLRLTAAALSLTLGGQRCGVLHMFAASPAPVTVSHCERSAVTAHSMLMVSLCEAAVMPHRNRKRQRGRASPREDVSLGLRQCALLNISVCEATVEATAERRGFRRACQRWHRSLSNMHHHYMLPTQGLGGRLINNDQSLNGGHRAGWWLTTLSAGRGASLCGCPSEGTVPGPSSVRDPAPAA